jgi:hypothetical protein
MKARSEKKSPETKVRNKANRLVAIADKLQAGASTESIAEELAHIGQLCVGLAEAWTEE